MRINIKFLQTGGVPLTNDLMETLQDAYKIFNVLGDLAGNLTILSGCNVVGTTVEPGIVVINGDVLYFEGGLISQTVFINKEEILKTFEDQTSKILIEKRTVKFGLSDPGNMWNWAEFTKLSTLKQLQTDIEAAATQADLDDAIERIEILELKTAPIINGGVYWAFGKPASEIPVGWKECTDLRGKTMFGWNPDDITFSTMGVNIGSKTKTIAKVNLPAIGINYEDVEPGNPDWMGGGFDGGNNHFTRRQKTTQNLGSGIPMDVLNPGRIVLFIEPNFQ